MGAATLGRVLVQATLDNMGDLLEVKERQLASDQVRSLTEDALVDTGSTYLAMPKSKLNTLGFSKPYGSTRRRSAKGVAKLKLYGPARLRVRDRYCTVDIAETAEGHPILIGQVPLELMDLVGDPKRQRLNGNPEHGGEWIIDMFRAMNRRDDR